MSIVVDRNEAGNTVTFSGTGVAASGVHPNACLTPRINGDDPDTVDIVNNHRRSTTPGTPGEFLEYRGIHFSEFQDVNGNTFASAAEVVAFLQSVCSTPAVADIINEYDLYVTADYTNDLKTGTLLQPFTEIQDAVDAAVSGDSILLNGTFVITQAISLPVDKTLYFYGTDGTQVKYAAYDATNGNVFEQINSTVSTKEYHFYNLTISNAGGYGILIKHGAKVVVEDCELFHNGWNGQGLSTTEAEVPGTLGYDSSAADLQAFYAGSNASNGGAIRIELATQLEVIGNTVVKNLRGIRVADCGVNGYGFITRNISSRNIESGIYLAPTANHGGCQNVVVSINSSSYNANNGLLAIGGINNKFSQNEVNGNWNAGLYAWASANLTLRDCGLYDNNRSEFNGIGNTGDAMASIAIGDAFSRLGVLASLDAVDYRFIAEILDTQVHYTGLGSNTNRVGFALLDTLNGLAANPKNIIKVDDVGFIGQDYAIDLSAVDTTNLLVTLGDNSYHTIGINAVNPPLAGDYYELPFSNHITALQTADFSVDSTGSVTVREGPGGARLNPYQVNDLHAVAHGSQIKVLLKGSDKIQFTVPVSGCSIDGVFVNSVLSQALVQLNDLFTNTVGFSATGNPVTAFYMSAASPELTLTLQDGTSFTVDVTTLGVDENKFVVSGALNGSDLELTMNDSSVVTIDASNMINGSQLPALSANWFVAYGEVAGTQITAPTFRNATKNVTPFYLGEPVSKGEEFIWNHDDSGTLHLGLWQGPTDEAEGVDAVDDANWSIKFKIEGSSAGGGRDLVCPVVDPGTLRPNNSVGVDIDSRYANGYSISNSTVFALRYAEDDYLYLYDITGGADIIIGRSNVALDGNPVYLHATGQAVAVQTRLPVFTQRFIHWSIVHDFDSSETAIRDGVEEATVLRSNLTLDPGQKILVGLQYFGRGESLGLSYSGAATGNATANEDLGDRLFYNSAELLRAVDGAASGSIWSWNTSAAGYYDPNGDGSNVGYTNGNGNSLGVVSFRYLTNNTVELWSETNGERIATLVAAKDGSSLNVFVGFDEAHTFDRVPTISRQDINQGSQPVVSFAPAIANQAFDVTEGQAFNVQIALQSGSSIVNQYGETDAPSWAVLNQATGVFNGTAPAFQGTSDDNVVINCKAANVLGGVTNFTITLNVVEPTYTNTSSLFFEDAVQSYLGGNAALVTALERAANGAGAGDAWSIGFWYKGSSNNQGQTIFYFGHNDTVNNGHIELRQTNHNGLKRLRLRYGSNVNYLQFTTPSGSVTPGTWQHFLVTYDGGTTGSASGSVSTYYTRFKIYIDGVLQATSNTHNNFGYSNAIVGQNYRFGRFSSGNYLRDGYLNQLCIWDSDQSSNITGIYNGGATQDMTDSTTMDGSVDVTYAAPDHYYEITNSVSTVPDIKGTAHFVGYNFSASDLVTDAP